MNIQISKMSMSVLGIIYYVHRIDTPGSVTLPVVDFESRPEHQILSDRHFRLWRMKAYFYATTLTEVFGFIDNQGTCVNSIIITDGGSEMSISNEAERVLAMLRYS